MCGIIIPDDQINGFQVDANQYVVEFTLNDVPVPPPSPDLINIVINNGSGRYSFTFIDGLWYELPTSDLYVLSGSDNLLINNVENNTQQLQCNGINTALFQKYSSGSYGPNSYPIDILNSKVLFLAVDATNIQQYDMITPPVVPSNSTALLYGAYDQDWNDIDNQVTNVMGVYSINLTSDNVAKYVIIQYTDVYVIYYFYYTSSIDVPPPVLTVYTTATKTIPIVNNIINVSIIGQYNSPVPNIPGTLTYIVNGNIIEVDVSTLTAGQSGFLQYYSIINSTTYLINQIISLPPVSLFNDDYSCVNTLNPGYNTIDQICPDGLFVHRQNYTGVYNDNVYTTELGTMMYLPQYSLLRGGRGSVSNTVNSTYANVWDKPYLGTDTICWGYNRGIGCNTITAGINNNAVNLNSIYTGGSNENFTKMTNIQYNWNAGFSTMTLISSNISNLNLTTGSIIAFTDTNNVIYSGKITILSPTSIWIQPLADGNTALVNKFQLPTTDLFNQSGKIKVVFDAKDLTADKLPVYNPYKNNSVLAGINNDTSSIFSSMVSGSNNAVLYNSCSVISGGDNISSSSHNSIAVGQSNNINTFHSITYGTFNKAGGFSNIQGGDQNILSGYNMINSGVQNTNYYYSITANPNSYYDTVSNTAILIGQSNLRLNILKNSLVVMNITSSAGPIQLVGGVIDTNVSGANLELIIGLNTTRNFVGNPTIDNIQFYIHSSGVLSGEFNNGDIANNSIIVGEYNRITGKNNIIAGVNNRNIYYELDTTVSSAGSNILTVNATTYPGIFNTRFTGLNIIATGNINGQDYDTVYSTINNEYSDAGNKYLVTSGGFDFDGNVKIKLLNYDNLVQGDTNELCGDNNTINGYGNSNNGISTLINGNSNFSNDEDTLMSGVFNYSNKANIYYALIQVTVTPNQYIISSSAPGFPFDFRIGTYVVTNRTLLIIISQSGPGVYVISYVAGLNNSADIIGSRTIYVSNFQTVNPTDPEVRGNIICGKVNFTSNLASSVVLGSNNSIHNFTANNYSFVIGKGNYSENGVNYMFGEFQENNSNNSNNNVLLGYYNKIYENTKNSIILGIDNINSSNSDSNVVTGNRNNLNNNIINCYVGGNSNFLQSSSNNGSNSCVVGYQNGSDPTKVRGVISNSCLIGYNNGYNVENSCILGVNYKFNQPNNSSVSQDKRFINSVLLGDGSYFSTRDLPLNPNVYTGMLLALDTNTANTNIHTWSNNQCIMRYTNGYYLYTGDNLGAKLDSGASSWTSICSKTVKTKIQDVDHEQTLEKLDQLTVEQWHYNKDPTQHGYIGPYAEDFHQLFDSQASDGIQTLELDGVALSSIKGLYTKHKKLEQDHQELKNTVELLNDKIEQLTAIIQQLTK